MYKLVIFDLDGTLLNTIDDLCTATNVALQHFGYPLHTVEECKTFVGNGIYKLVERSLPKDQQDQENVWRVKAVFDAYYSQHSQDQTCPYEGIETLLEQLGQRKIDCGVVTNKAHAYAGQLIKGYFGDRIQLTLGQREGIKTKPDPCSVFEMMDHFKVKPEECLYVGDSNVDIETAKAAGVTSIGVLWGFRGEAELKQAGADHLAECPEDILKIAIGS